jgi:hypothetical protein
VSTTRIKKTLAALAILLFFTFGAVALSLAHGSASAGPRHSIHLRHIFKSGLVQSQTAKIITGMNLESGDVPRSPRPDLQDLRYSYGHVVSPLAEAIFVNLYVPKVSLQILESVLLL